MSFNGQLSDQATVRWSARIFTPTETVNFWESDQKWQPGPLFKPEGVHLRLTRVGNVIKGWYSHDGEAWELVHELEVDLSYQLQVGVYGIKLRTPSTEWCSKTCKF